MASPNPTRRVLGALSSNTPISSTKSSLLGSKPTSIGSEKENALAKFSLQNSTIGGVGKRLLDLEETSPPSKRQKVQIEAQPIIASTAIVDDNTETHDSSSSRSSSPSSSQNTVLNDSLNTTVTEPDMTLFEIARITSQVLTKAQIREKAIELKLRLRLANYKVRTNQIDLPFSRLEIRSLGGASASLPKLRRTPLPTSTLSSSFSSIPEVRIQNPSSEKKASGYMTTIPSSPPPAYSPCKQDRTISYERDEGIPRALATPLLPRHIEAGDDVTSSDVKGRAADGLLSLMHQA